MNVASHTEKISRSTSLAYRLHNYLLKSAGQLRKVSDTKQLFPQPAQPWTTTQKYSATLKVYKHSTPGWVLSTEKNYFLPQLAVTTSYHEVKSYTDINVTSWFLENMQNYRKRLAHQPDKRVNKNASTVKNPASKCIAFSLKKKSNTDDRTAHRSDKIINLALFNSATVQRMRRLWK